MGTNAIREVPTELPELRCDQSNSESARVGVNQNVKMARKLSKPKMRERERERDKCGSISIKRGGLISLGSLHTNGGFKKQFQ